MKYDFAMVVGRFQPYHNIHHKLLTHALSLGQKLIVVLGSSYSNRTPKNPFTATEREEMIRACFPKETQDRLIFAHIRDYQYNENMWITEIQNIANQEIEKYVQSFDHPVANPTMVLVGHFKDETSYYLNLFPQWKFEHFDSNPKESQLLCATNIRELLFELPEIVTEQYNEQLRNIEGLVPSAVYEYLVGTFLTDSSYKSLREQHAYLKKYKADHTFKNSPFPPTFVTTDTIVTTMGHVLVVRRRGHLGKGQLAFPGGFLAQGLTLKENALKELKEETRIKVNKAVLESNIVNERVFDNPNRSLRGRTITHAFHIKLKPDLAEGLPHVKGGDDAESALWLSIADFFKKEDEFFEDHHEIGKYFLYRDEEDARNA